MRLTREEIEALDALAAKATERPWRIFKSRKTLCVNGPTGELGGHDCVVNWPGFDSSDKPWREQIANAAMFTALVNAWPTIRSMALAQIEQERRFDALCRALKTHAGDTDGYEFGLGRVKFEHGTPVSFLWAGQDEIDAAIDAALTQT